MADAVTSQTTTDGPKITVMSFTNVSDGTGESDIKKVDVSTLEDAPSEVRILRIWYSTHGMSVDILWDATTNVIAQTMPEEETDFLDYRAFSGLLNNAGSGKTGDILFKTRGHTAGDSYTITLELSKS